MHFRQWGHYRAGDTVEARAQRLRACCGQGSVPTVVVALVGSGLCGSAMLAASDMDTHPELSPWLAGVYVKAEYRRRGVGSALVTRVTQEASDWGATRLYLCTDGSEALYARLGWQPIERSAYKGTTVTVMARDLADGSPPMPGPLRGPA